jgi:citrate lyase beta subunit
MLPTKNGQSCRSILFFPANDVHKAEKAAASDADVLILDLEDAVAPSEKENARNTLIQMLDTLDFRGKKVVVRINPLNTPWGRDDLETIKEHPKVQGIMLPKINDRNDIIEVADIAQNKPIWAVMETARGIFNIRNIVPSKNVEALIFGNNDLSAEMGVDSDNHPALAHARGEVMLAARAHNLMVFDGPSPNLAQTPEDRAAHRKDCEYSRELGFDGKCVVHLDQIRAANITFSPTPQEIQTAQKIVTAYGNAGIHGVIKVGGRMIEELHARHAKNTLKIAEGLGLTLKRLKLPDSVRQGFIEYVTPLKEPQYDPYNKENFPQIRYALEREMWRLLQVASEAHEPGARELIAEIEKQRANKGSVGFIIDNFPIDEKLPATPSEPDDYTTQGKGWVSELASYAFHSLLDRAPIIIPGLRGDNPIQQISPRKGQEQNAASSLGSKAAFRAHTDSSHLEQPPEFFCLVALRNNENAKTNIALVQDILNQLTEEELKVLQQPIFNFSTGAALDRDKMVTLENVPVLTYQNGTPRLRFNTAESRMYSSTSDGNDVIQRLNDILDFALNPALDKGVELQAGQAIFIDNGQAAHARTSFTPDNSEQRWLQRVLTNSVSRDNPFPTSI